MCQIHWNLKILDFLVKDLNSEEQVVQNFIILLSQKDSFLFLQSFYFKKIPQCYQNHLIDSKAHILQASLLTLLKFYEIPKIKRNQIYEFLFELIIIFLIRYLLISTILTLNISKLFQFDRVSQINKFVVDMIVILQSFKFYQRYFFRYLVSSMAQRKCFLKKQKNHEIKDQFHHDKNQFHFFDECKKSLISKCKIRNQNKPQIHEIFNQKSLNINISISELNTRVQGVQLNGTNDRQVNFNRKKSTFCQFEMNQERRFSFSDHLKDDNLDKENIMGLSNQALHNQRTYVNKSLESKAEKVEKLQQKLSQAHIKATKNYNQLQKNIFTQDPLQSTRRLQLINNLISMLQTNKNIRIRSLFQQRQLVSQQRAQQKRQCQKKLEKINQIENKVNTGKINKQIAQRQMSDFQAQLICQ